MQATAIFYKPLDTIDQINDALCNDPVDDALMTITHQTEGYTAYLQEKIRAKDRHIDNLQSELKNQRADITSYRVAIGCALAALAITLYQWLVVCNGQSPLY